MLRRATLFFLSVIFGLVFLFFTQLVKRDYFKQIDFDLIVKLQDRVPQSLTPLFTTTSTLASFEIVVLILIVLTLFLLLKRKWGAVFILPSLAVAHVIEIYGKTLINHISPPMYFVKEFDTVIFPNWYSHPESSYPSGHAMRVVFLIVILIAVLNKSKFKNTHKNSVSVLLIAYCIVTILGRVALGTHWPTDVVGGGLLGLALSFLVLVFI
ncbi:MAG: phosphatase PAP2 family protein [bacterium]|nr:phosphatase PAP2 family protein [bacterium]